MEKRHVHFAEDRTAYIEDDSTQTVLSVNTYTRTLRLNSETVVLTPFEYNALLRDMLHNLVSKDLDDYEKKSLYTLRLDIMLLDNDAWNNLRKLPQDVLEVVTITVEDFYDLVSTSARFKTALTNVEENLFIEKYFELIRSKDVHTK